LTASVHQVVPGHDAWVVDDEPLNHQSLERGRSRDARTGGVLNRIPRTPPVLTARARRRTFSKTLVN
jgi:hypothetical protein